MAVKGAVVSVLLHAHYAVQAALYDQWTVQAEDHASPGASA